MNPFTEKRSASAGGLGESLLIRTIREWLGEASPPAPAGIGDDCAVFSTTPGKKSLVTTDPVLWGRHFDEKVSPEDAAGKLFKRNLSDIAAMGGRPRIAVVSLLLPAETSLEWLKRFHLGLRDVSLKYEVPLAGGDVSQTDGLLGACMTVIGETTGDRALTRAGASPGDHLFVTGHLGGSRLGHHFSFEPRLQEGQWLSAREEVVAGMDLSDGLAKDLLALIPTDCDVSLFPDSIPLSQAALTLAGTTGRPPLEHALCDGEDHELLVAVKGDADLDAFFRSWSDRFSLPLTRIGLLKHREKNAEGSRFRGLPPEITDDLHGYEHLR